MEVIEVRDQLSAELIVQSEWVKLVESFLLRQNEDLAKSPFGPMVLVDAMGATLFPLYLRSDN